MVDQFTKGYITGQLAMAETLLESEKKLYDEFLKLHVKEKRPHASEYLKITLERQRLNISLYEKMVKTLRQCFKETI